MGNRRMRMKLRNVVWRSSILRKSGGRGAGCGRKDSGLGLSEDRHGFRIFSLHVVAHNPRVATFFRMRETHLIVGETTSNVATGITIVLTSPECLE